MQKNLPSMSNLALKQHEKAPFLWHFGHMRFFSSPMSRIWGFCGHSAIFFLHMSKRQAILSLFLIHMIDSNKSFALINANIFLLC